MRWIRTWPAKMPPVDGPSGYPRNYVVDQLPRVEMEFDYVPVFRQLTGDTVIVEWDIAFGPEEITAFEKHVAGEPGRVQVAPYRLYPRSTMWPGPVWAHRYNHGGVQPWISEGDPFCDWFGFGFIYFPLPVVHHYLATDPFNEGDTDFSRWHHSEYGQVPVRWDVRPVHLHY